MAVMSFAVAREAVRKYNEKRCTREVARLLQIEREEVYALVDWLWNKSYAREKDIDNSKTNKRVLPELTQDAWTEYLFINKVPTRHVERSLDWTFDRVAARWVELRRGRKRKAACAREQAADADDREPDDPPPEEIWARAAEIQKAREKDAPNKPVVRRVEVQIWTDTRH